MAPHLAASFGIGLARSNQSHVSESRPPQTKVRDHANGPATDTRPGVHPARRMSDSTHYSGD